MTAHPKKRILQLVVLGFFTAALMVVSECGYRPVRSTIPGGADGVSIPLVKNRTAHGGLSGSLTAALRNEVAVRGLKVVSADERHRFPRLEVTITEVGHAPEVITVKNQRITPTERLVSVSASAMLIDSAGNLIAGPVDFTCQGRSLVGQTALAEEALAKDTRGELLMKLASRVASSFFDSL